MLAFCRQQSDGYQTSIYIKKKTRTKKKDTELEINTKKTIKILSQRKGSFVLCFSRPIRLFYYRMFVQISVFFFSPCYPIVNSAFLTYLGPFKKEEQLAASCCVK